MKTISLLIAMEGEAAEIIRSLALKPYAVRSPFTAMLPFRFFEGTLANSKITLTTLGRDPRFDAEVIGTEAAATAALSTLQEFHSDVLISVGTAGSFAAAGAEVAKVYLSDRAFYFHDHRIPLAKWQRMGRGEFPAFDVRSLAKKLGLSTADVSSGNSLSFNDDDLKEIRTTGATLKEMEAGGIAWVATQTQTPFFAIKAVTNLLDRNPDSAAEFEKNFDKAVQSLTRATLQVLSALTNATEPITPLP